MRPLTGLAAAAFAGLAVAAKDTAGVYLLRSTPQLETTSVNPIPIVPKEVARHIFLQRTSRDRYGSSLNDIPSSVSVETAITYVSTFGRSRQPLLSSSDGAVEPAQLIVLLEGIDKNFEPLREALSKAGQQLAFVILEPPSTGATHDLMFDLRSEGASTSVTCSVESAINPNDRTCWDGLSSVVRYDVKESPEIISSLTANLDRLLKFVSAGELEVLLVALPESSRTSKLTSWSSRRPSTPSNDLRRRAPEDELVISDDPAPAPAATSPNTPAAATTAFWADNQAKGSAARIPACFQSLNSCETRTNNCSGGHGVCIDRYANDTKAKHQPCFACHCMRTVVLDGTEKGAFGKKTVRWAGNACQKKDISVQFWLLAGFTVGIVGVVTFAIGMLYSVGEEKLPGVIGAGVSRGSSK